MNHAKLPAVAICFLFAVSMFSMPAAAAEEPGSYRRGDVNADGQQDVSDAVRILLFLFLGEGEIDFPPLFRALDEVRYEGLCLVELSRHSHAAPEMAARSIEFLRRVLPR